MPPLHAERRAQPGVEGPTDTCALRLRSALLCLGVLTLTACPAGKVETDGGQPPPDLCDTKDEAKSNADCQLPLGKYLSSVTYDGGRYISEEGDEDWYSVSLPATVTAKSLLHVTGGYNYTGAPVPSSAVNFFLNVLRDDGTTSLISGVDKHLSATPKPVDLIKTLAATDANKQLFLFVRDAPADPRNPQFDAKHPYDLRAEVVENPDSNEPNDTTPTPLPLTAQSGYQGAKVEGYLATPGDVDRFTFDVPAGRKVIYLHLDLARVNELNSNRPANYRLSYTLLAPDGTTTVSQGRALNQSSQTNLTDARLAAKLGVPTSGTYTLVVQGYKDVNTVGQVPGDLDFKYALDLRLFDDLDANEGGSGNDVMNPGTPISVSSAPVSKTGRLGYAGDRDWYVVHVAPNASNNTLLHFKLTPGSGSRFPIPLPGSADHELRVLSVVSGGSSACISSDTSCPKGYAYDQEEWVSTVTNYCSLAVPLCLWSSRTESQVFTNFKNMEGAVPVKPHSGTVDYYVLVQDSGNDWADDKDYTLTVSVDDDSDENTKGGPISGTLNTLASATNFSGAAVLNGMLGAGHGFLLARGNGGFDSSKGEGVIGPEDYDAVIDADEWVLDIPQPAQAPFDRMLALQWSVENNSDGSKAFDLAIKVQYCEDQTCAPAQRVNGGIVGFSTSSLDNGGQASWWNRDWLLTDLLPLFNATSGSPKTYTINPYACFCLEKQFVQSRKLIITALAADRTNYDASKQYTLRVGNSPYDEPFTLKDGGVGKCPQPTVDGGVQLTKGCRITGG